MICHKFALTRISIALILEKQMEIDTCFGFVPCCEPGFSFFTSALVTPETYGNEHLPLETNHANTGMNWI